MAFDTDVKPYRVEWRANLVIGFVLIRDCETHDEALAEAKVARGRWKGQTRIIAQHVIEVGGLGAD